MMKQFYTTNYITHSVWRKQLIFHIQFVYPFWVDFVSISMETCYVLKKQLFIRSNDLKVEYICWHKGVNDYTSSRNVIIEVNHIIRREDGIFKVMDDRLSILLIQFVLM